MFLVFASFIISSGPFALGFVDNPNQFPSSLVSTLHDKGFVMYTVRSDDNRG